MTRQPTPAERARAERARRAAVRAFVEDAAFLAGMRETPAAAAGRLGVSEAALERRLYRSGRGDVWNQLRANDPAAVSAPHEHGPFYTSRRAS